MTIFEGLLIFFTIVFIYFIIVYILHKKGILKKYNISFYGPGLLFRTKKGVGFLEKIASKKRFWKAYGSTGILVCFIVMVLFVFLLVFQSFILFDLEPEQKELIPGPEAAFPIPGLNPILPIEYFLYIILGLIIALIVHEFSHGILSIVGKIKVKSLGMLLLVIPIGAFTEPDEEELKKTDIPKRMRVYAAGPLSNFAVAFICLLLFSFIFMSAVQPISGVDIFYVLDDTPAESIGLSKGCVITNINDTKVVNSENFALVMNNTKPNQNINIIYMIQEEKFSTNVELISRYDYHKNYYKKKGIELDESINQSIVESYKEYYESKGIELNESFNQSIIESLKNDSFLGIGFNPYNKEYLLSSIKNPFTYRFPDGLFNLYALPFFGYIARYNPIAYPFTNSYIITGPLNALPTELFWGIINTLYWVFWISLALGIFNVLPMIPLDGGFLFNDAFRVIVKKIKKDITNETRDKIVRKITTIASIAILLMILLPFLVKYI
ncbi:hypothetical protein AYK24_01585 [Thermoplasmatales archaeon SG8-52-4]|nr:MAG: hypothetical protein AYK24_01585 [Thermoplasmatales archaeon SG8-52-4]